MPERPETAHVEALLVREMLRLGAEQVDPNPDRSAASPAEVATTVATAAARLGERRALWAVPVDLDAVLDIVVVPVGGAVSASAVAPTDATTLDEAAR
jgi:hypothetical protein